MSERVGITLKSKHLVAEQTLYDRSLSSVLVAFNRVGKYGINFQKTHARERALGFAIVHTGC